MKEGIFDVDNFKVLSDHSFGSLRVGTFDSLAYYPNILSVRIFMFLNEVLDFVWWNHAENASTGLSRVSLSQSMMGNKWMKTLLKVVDMLVDQFHLVKDW